VRPKPSAPKFCGRCGTPNAGGRFCGGCGQAWSQPATSADDGLLYHPTLAADDDLLSILAESTATTEVDGGEAVKTAAPSGTEACHRAGKDPATADVGSSSSSAWWERTGGATVGNAVGAAVGSAMSFPLWRQHSSSRCGGSPSSAVLEAPAAAGSLDVEGARALAGAACASSAETTDRVGGVAEDSAVEAICPQCGALNAGGRFCGGCGRAWSSGQPLPSGLHSPSLALEAFGPNARAADSVPAHTGEAAAAARGLSGARTPHSPRKRGSVAFLDAPPPPPPPPPPRDVWELVGRWVVASPSAVLALLTLLFLPFLYVTSVDSVYSAELTSLVPASMPAGLALRELETRFGTGLLYPYYILVTSKPSNPQPLFSAPFFAAAHEVLQQMVLAVPGTPRQNITGAFFANGEPVPFELVRMAFDAGTSFSNTTTGGHLRSLIETFFTKDGDATFLYVIKGDPFGDVSRRWLHEARSYLEEVSQAGGYEWQIAGMGAVTIDTQDSVLAAFPLVIGTTALTVFCLLGCAFGSVLVPMRSVLTTACTLVFVYATLQIVQGGAPYHLLQLELRAPWECPGVAWLVPVMTFTVLTGLNTDYDVFLVAGIRKMRALGASNDDAIVSGLRSNGGVITTAGAIMALAFSGLLASSTLAVHQVTTLDA